MGENSLFMDNAFHILSIVVFCIVLLTVINIVKNKVLSIKILHRKYMLQLAQLIIIVLCILRVTNILNPSLNLRSILLTGSAVIVAIVGFAAQTAIADVICGFLISIHKPFEIGDRIIIDGLDPGIVEDITLRHIVVAIYDGLKIIVPNSQLNSKTVTNFSYKNKERNGVHLQYSVSFDTDVQKAMDIIRDCVAESPYTLGAQRNGVMEDSGPVYFLKFADSALLLDTTIFVQKGTSTYVATTDVNIRVNEAFKKNGIEIPYNYLNVIEMEQTKQDAPIQEKIRKTLPERRHYRTNNIRLTGDDADVQKATELSGHFSDRQRLVPKDAKLIELLTEESLSLFKTLVGAAKANMWIEGSGYEFRIHISLNTRIGTDEYKRLLAVSSTGRNEAFKGVAGHIFDAMMRGVQAVDSSDNNQKFVWDMNSKEITQDELSESILGAFASGIKISVTKENVEFIVEKAREDKKS
ncbi:mechanosensitive ion channel family protein [Butyrivibrio sp. AE3004]|uniref:mechanosensitive ion channel family protein n=1 Tax=Butyrivibrio sp. AE3004 TaxID=1506994 RepID=UPI000494D772|nr:mechanosensitive ion channel domain-containing protein [Butyrivibrio sp. AE3004]